MAHRISINFSKVFHILIYFAIESLQITMHRRCCEFSPNTVLCNNLLTCKHVFQISPLGEFALYADCATEIVLGAPPAMQHLLLQAMGMCKYFFYNVMLALAFLILLCIGPR